MRYGAFDLPEKLLYSIHMVDITHHDKLFIFYAILLVFCFNSACYFRFPLESTVVTVPFQEVSDDRMKKVNELFQGMKLIKLYAWETIFCGLINEVRWKQIRLLFKSACINALNSKFPSL